MRRLSHNGPETVGAAIERCAARLTRARAYFGHGTDNARDEAAELVFFAAGLAHELGASAYGRTLTARCRARIDELLRRRIALRVPLPYLTKRAFFAGLELYVDERVLVPRSPIAELIQQRFAPWIAMRRGCVASSISERARVRSHSPAPRRFRARAWMRVDISAAALQVCRRNVRRLRLKSRVEVIRSDHFAEVPGRRYDIIVSNPPYVGSVEMRTLPREYRHEPRLGLASGVDGLDSVRAILGGARAHLKARGILVVEVGNSEMRCCGPIQPRVSFGPRLRWAAAAFLF
jgi:ribosomal protein L3 glutamine methyltransferase